MKHSQTHSLLALTAGGLLALPAVPGAADVIGAEDFDGGAVNLTSSSVPTLDGGPGDSFAVGATEAWPTTGGTPFGLADNTTGDVGDATFFAADTEGVYGVNSDFTNKFLGISDSDEFEDDQTASWTFDISNATDLSLSIGMGGISDASAFGGWSTDTLLTFTVSIDGGAAQTAFTIAPNADANTFSYRAMDNGSVTPDEGGNGPLEVTGDNAVTKTLADSLAAAADTFLDKTPASGAGAGELDTFTTAIDGTGSELVLTLTANLPFEAVAFDNIVINGVPEPASLALVGLGGLAMLGRRRNRA